MAHMNEEMDPLSSTTDGKHRHSTSTVGAAQNRGGVVMKRPGADEGVGISHRVARTGWSNVELSRLPNIKVSVAGGYRPVGRQRSWAININNKKTLSVLAHGELAASARR
ncbi:hypothetical protein CPLU01_01661 [Colletotrichum plurivorum]|uniref:Uncharacterized protein n=1 Tax=Colletotrichum plurivorum TaxID=2175906 RepID=A0A8H6U0E6_9PEZI|nr:hypothetical protein CPLU01_01661 [Colletotrichum plurivorum]